MHLCGTNFGSRHVVCTNDPVHPSDMKVVEFFDSRLTTKGPIPTAQSSEKDLNLDTGEFPKKHSQTLTQFHKKPVHFLGGNLQGI